MRPTRACVLALIFAATCASLTRAQVSPAHPRISQALELARVWLEAGRAYDQIPGVSAAIVHDQQVLWIGGFGYADAAAKRPAAPDTIYSICSISKLFTSIAVMQLRDAGKVRLDDPVGRHLPWFRIKPVEGEPGEITIEGVLTHASGLPRESDFPYWTGPAYDFPTREQVIERVSSQQMLYPAETFFQYSNLGLTLAGEVAAAASGLSYDELVRKQILAPLQLASTTPEMPVEQCGKRMAVGYSGLGREGRRLAVPFFTAKGVAPAAGYASTAEDLARLVSWQFRLLERGGTEVLKATTLREMQRVHWADPDLDNTRGLGFQIWRSGDKTFIGHGGSCPGFRSHVLIQRETKVGTVFLSNAQGVNAQMYAQRLYDIVGPVVAAAVKQEKEREKERDKKAAQAEKGPSVPDKSLGAYAGSYSASFSGTETAVVPWEDGLAMLSLPTMDPMAGLVKLKKVGEHTFRRVRKDETLGEAVVFEMGTDGRASRYTHHSNRYDRR